MPFRLPGLRALFRRALLGWRRFLKGAGSVIPGGKNVGGTCLCCFLACCFTGLSRGGMISRAQLISRFEMFIKGECTALVRAGEACATQAGDARRRKRRRERGMAQRLSRAEALVHLGELSSARQALEGADLAPGNEETLKDQRCRETSSLRNSPDICLKSC